jgi:membrane protein DedA with SNARE-associated domain
MELINTIVVWYMEHINYLSITILMTIESSFIPFPSEVVIPPAAWKAAEGSLNIFLVIFFGTFGSLLGAIANYYLALWLGRPFIYRFVDSKLGRLCLLDRKKVEEAENLFNKYGNITTFVCRLLPAIRQLISLPAGLARMKMSDFLIYTFLGALIWNIILALLGYFLFSQKAILETYYHHITIGLIGLGLVFFGYIIYKVLRKQPVK